MYQGKHVKRTKYSYRRANRRKSTVLLTSLALLMAILVGTTTAFLIATSEPVTNIFNPATVTSDVEESFENDVKSNVKIKNTGNTEAYIRATFVVTWKDNQNRNVYGTAPVEGTDYIITLNQNGWFKGSDEFYYYKQPVAAGSSTAVLINSCAPVAGKTPVGYGLNVEILSSAIQSTPTSVVASQWGVTVADDGTISK